MGNTVTLSDTVIIVLGVLAVVFAALVLYAISLVSKLMKMIMEGQSGSTTQESSVQGPINNYVAPQNPVQSFNEADDEEDRLVVALAASAMAADDKPDSHFHISKITRIK
jgi:glutaconyl-CoA/methylmalonyl-CoA decarboxylase subunit delta